MIRVSFALFLLAALTALCGPAAGMDVTMSGAVADAFDPAAARQPRPGEWLEYRIAFLTDPLEHSLAPDRNEVAPTGRQPTRLYGGEAGDLVFFAPHFEPDRVWQVTPLRLEIREVGADGCNAVMTFAGRSHELFLKKGNGDNPGTSFHYDREGSADGRGTVRIGEYEYEVNETRRIAERYGLVRWVSGDVPFGVVRFATPDIDMALVGMGVGRSPDFPLESESEITPPLGLLYYGEGLSGDAP